MLNYSAANNLIYNLAFWLQTNL